jgi:predicted metal-dependent enzyme (double-stranded beta helix superfamily)
MMKRLDVLLATASVCAAIAVMTAQGAQSSANLPPPFPRDGAKQLLDNDRVIVWDVVWPKGQPTALHRHRHDLAGVYLEPGTRVITDADGSKRHVSNDAGGVTFQLKGLTHVEEGTSDAPLHAIMIELKQDAPVGDDPSADLPPAFPREGAKQLLDNDRVRIWDYTFTPRRVGPLHRHVRDAVAVWLEGGKLKTTPRDGAPGVNTQTKFTATYSRRGTVHTEEAIEGAPHAYVFELK